MSSRTEFYSEDDRDKKLRPSENLVYLPQLPQEICSSRAVDSGWNTRRSPGSLCMCVDEDKFC